LIIQDIIIFLKIKIKKIRSLRVGINEDEGVMLSNDKIDQVENFAYLGSTIDKDGDTVKTLKSEIAEASNFFFHVKKSVEE